MINRHNFWTDLKEIYATGITTQHFKYNGVSAVRYVTMMLIRLCVTFRENFMEVKFGVVLWSSVKLSRHQLCLLALFSVKIDFDLNWRFLFLSLSFLFTNLLINMLFTCEEKRFIYPPAKLCRRLYVLPPMLLHRFTQPSNVWPDRRSPPGKQYTGA